MLDRGIPASAILEESSSLETVGNAFFTRVQHTDVLGLRKLLVINNAWHMPRTKAVFDHVFSVPPVQNSGTAAEVDDNVVDTAGVRSSTAEVLSSDYELDYDAVEEAGLAADVLESRLAREAQALPKFAGGGPWRAETPDLRRLHKWEFHENTAYASKRLLVEKAKVLDPSVAKSY